MRFQNLPNGWEIRKMPQVVKWGSGGTPKATEKQYYDGGTIPWLIIGDLNDGIVTSSASKITKLGLQNSSAKMIPAGTLLVAMYGSIGKLGITGIECCTNQAIAYAKELFGVTTKYMFYYMALMKSDLISMGKGGTQKNISQTVLNSLDVVVPPLPEQERIVARIEELFSQLDAGVETLKKTKAQLAVYRQAVLKEAFEGRLTEEWRRGNGISKQCFVQLSRKKRDSALAYRKMKPLKYEWKNDIFLPRIPQEWEYAQIGDIAWSIKDGPHYSPEYSEEGIPFITGGNVRPTGVDFQSAKRISLELHKELCKRCCPEKGDMLYTKGGTTGIARINTYDQEFSVWVHVAVIKYVDSVLPEYFQHVLNSPLCYQQSQKYTHGVGNQDLGLTRMINIIFPICSIEEQKQIVANLESRLSVCDSIEKTVNAALQQAEAMRQSILKAAFEGR